MEILTYPNEHLRKKTSSITKVTPELIDIANEMYATMRAANGIGLAANQVGLDMSLIVLEDNGGPLIMFNPVILKRSPDQQYSGESCLSFPGVSKLIKRSKEITIKYRDVQNKMQYIVLKGLQARCAAHEIEHLQAVLLIDHLEK